MTRHGAFIIGVIAAAILAAASFETRAGELAGQNVVRFDFETGDLQGWRVVEGKFDFLVADKKTFRNTPSEKYNKQGQWFLTTLELKNGTGNDGMTGVVESPVFVLSGPEMSFLVGGGGHPETYVALCTLDGKEVVQARGRNAETMFRTTWSKPELVGKPVFLRVVDGHTSGWGHITFDDFTAAGRIDPQATADHFAKRKKVLKPGVLAGGGGGAGRFAELPSPGTPATLRAAIADLAATFGPRYGDAKAYLARLAEIEARLKAAGDDEQAAEKPQQDFLALQRQALLASPLVSGREILFVAREQYRPDHHNTETMFQTGEINTGSFRGPGSLKAIDVRTDKVRTLVEAPQGVVRDSDVSFDGKRVLVSVRRDIKDDYHIYEVDASASGVVVAPAQAAPSPTVAGTLAGAAAGLSKDTVATVGGTPSTGITQITSGAGVFDIDPLYLPDGRIAFGSSREPKYCMCNRHIMANLFRMNADGSNVHQIGKSTLFEGHGSLTEDGRILYDRWEYVDRNFGDAQGGWTCNPDGTNHAVWYGNNTASPGAILDARVVPGLGGDVFVATYSSCHDRPWGAIALVDRSRGIDSPGPELRLWPAAAMELVGKGNYDQFTQVWPKYEDPYPLADPADNAGAGRYFLCSRQIGRGEQMGIFLLDVFGNEVLLHAEDKLGCFDPMPLGPHARPPVVPDRTDLAAAEGSFYIYDVYVGTGMEKVRPGAVKRLRVVESPEKRFWTNTDWQGSGTQAPGMAWDDFNNKRILGSVPVEPDGSAYFTIPANRFVYFQLLDANGMMIQSMRSGTITRPGETTGCVGCHESRHSAVGIHPMQALRREPSKLEPFCGQPRLYNYYAEVQPVFDRNCVKCHDYGTDGGKKLLLAGDLGMIFNVSYVELRSKHLVNVPGAGPTQTLPPYSWGSHSSKLGAMMLKYLRDKTVSREDFDRVVTWIDINAPYYPTYASAYMDNLYGRSPLDNKQVARLSELVGVNLRDQKNATQVSFSRPEKSPCLARFADKSDPKYVEALGIIQAGKDMLAARPGAEMPGFKLEGIEARREAKYNALAEELDAIRRAMIAGEKRRPAGGP